MQVNIVRTTYHPVRLKTMFSKHIGEGGCINVELEVGVQKV